MSNIEQSYYIHPLFSEIERYFRYLLISMGMLTQKAGQVGVQKSWPTIDIQTSVNFDGNTVLYFSVNKAIKQFNQEFNVQNSSQSTTANLNAILKTQARLMVVYLYQIINGDESPYKTMVRRDLDNFIYHIRNAAAHDNKFHIFKRKNEKAEWRGKVIDDSMQGKVVFNDFICPADIIVLMSDLSRELRRIDETNSRA